MKSLLFSRPLSAATIAACACLLFPGTGRADFEVAALKENLDALLTDLRKGKPASAKGQYVMKLTVSSTMGPGVSVDRASVDS